MHSYPIFIVMDKHQVSEYGFGTTFKGVASCVVKFLPRYNPKAIQAIGSIQGVGLQVRVFTCDDQIYDCIDGMSEIDSFHNCKVVG